MSAVARMEPPGRREAPPDDRLRAIRGRRRVIPGFRGVYHRARIRATRWLNPSYLLNPYWSFATSAYAKTGGVDNNTGSSDLPVGQFVDRAVESFFRIFRKIFVAT